MDIEIDVKGLIPVYEQIVLQIESGVLDGKLKGKEPLPSIRQLADDLELNHNTVAKAYQLLERQGIIESHGRKGSFISSQSISNIKIDRKHRASINMFKMFDGLKSAGFSKDDIKILVSESLERTYEGDL